MVFRPEALAQLEELYDFVSDAGSPDIAADFTEAIVAFCESLTDFPLRGTARDDLRPGLRIIGFRKRVVLAYAIIGQTIAIIGVFYGGRDHERILRSGDYIAADPD